MKHQLLDISCSPRWWRNNIVFAFWKHINSSVFIVWLLCTFLSVFQKKKNYKNTKKQPQGCDSSPTDEKMKNVSRSGDEFSGCCWSCAAVRESAEGTQQHNQSHHLDPATASVLHTHTHTLKATLHIALGNCEISRKSLTLLHRYNS